MSLISKIGYNTAKGVTGFIAPLAAVSSTAGQGGDGVLDNIVAIYHVPKVFYDVGKAFVLDEGMRTTGFKLMGEVTDVVYNGAQNIVERPLETALTAAGVFVGIKFMPQMIKGIHNGYGKLKTRD